MEQSHLIELIKTLSAEEKKQILQFSSLSYFNQGKMRDRVPPFLELCFTQSWDSVEGGLDKNEFFSAIFPDQQFLEGKLEKLMVEAHKVVRGFLLIQRYFREENEFNQGFDFSEIVRTRGLEARHQQLLSRLKKNQKLPHEKNEAHFYSQFQLEYAIHDDESFRNQFKGDLNVPNVLHALDIHYYINRLALLNRYLLQRKVANIEIPDSFSPFLDENLVPERYIEGSPLIHINYVIFKLLKKDSLEPTDVQSLFDLLISQEQCVDQSNLREFYVYLRNFCVLISNSFLDNENIRLTLHELQKDNLARGYLHYEGKLHPSTYYGVSAVAVRVKQFDWALEFIEKYKREIIGENENQDIYRLNLANYFFGVGRFSDCLDNIPPTSPFVDYLLHGKRLELKALYELRSELLPYKLDAFKMFLSRTSPKLLSEAQRQTNSDFANLLHQLVYSNPGDPKRSELLVKRIQEKKQAAEWRWLLEKAKALKGG